LDDPPTRPRAGMSIAGFGKPQPPRAGARTGCGPYIGRTFVTVYPGVDRGSAASLPRGGLDLRLGQFLAVEPAVVLVIASAGAEPGVSKRAPTKRRVFLSRYIQVMPSGFWLFLQVMLRAVIFCCCCCGAKPKPCCGWPCFMLAWAMWRWLLCERAIR